jgi:hypothetical protein
MNPNPQAPRPDAATDAEVSVERALKDLAHIKELRESTAFNDYWLRRLKMKREEMWGHLLNDPPEVLNKDKREELRQVILFCDEVLKMPESDEIGCRRLLPG